MHNPEVKAVVDAIDRSTAMLERLVIAVERAGERRAAELVARTGDMGLTDRKT